ncbi:MAG: type II toxin-antitoxin system HicB family antitoxin [Thermoanaerobaculia bacterium]
MEPISALLNRYTRVVRLDDNGTFVASLSAIRGCHAIGDSPAEAEAELANVFQMIVEEYTEQGLPLPPDVSVLAVNAP